MPDEHNLSGADVQDLVLSLGDPWLSQNDSNILPSATEAPFSEHHQPVSNLYQLFLSAKVSLAHTQSWSFSYCRTDCSVIELLQT